MLNEMRAIYLDSELNIEAYHFKGIMQKFPMHFHDHYTIGFIEKGKRYLVYKDQAFSLDEGDLIVFNPGDSHSCEQVDDRALDFRAVNIKPDCMRKAVLDITGKDSLPYFRQPVLPNSELAGCLRELHTMIAEEEKDFKKEELFLLLIEELIKEYSDVEFPLARAPVSCEIQTVCDYLEENYAKNINLNDLCELAGLSKYYFLRSFTKQKGISPYRYLETIRINQAKQLLENGVRPIDAALQTGFSDQSHFNHFFKRLIGLTPAQYRTIFLDN